MPPSGAVRVVEGWVDERLRAGNTRFRSPEGEMYSRRRITGVVAAAAVAGVLAWSAGPVSAQGTAPTRTVADTAAATAAAPPEFTAVPDRSFDAIGAHQGVAVDAKYFYTV